MAFPRKAFGAPKRKVNPETIITRQIREMLRILKIPHFKHWGGPFSEPGVPDLIGTLPGSGRGLFIEVKVPGNTPKPDQRAFLETYRAAGALAFWADDPKAVVRALAEAGYEPAKHLGIL